MAAEQENAGKMRLDRVVESLFALFHGAGEADYFGEPVSQRDHALQSAALAERAGADENLVLAALFHDIGHICAPSDAPRMGEVGVVDHERIGAEYLAALGF